MQNDCCPTSEANPQAKALALGWQQSLFMSRLLIGSSDKTNLLLQLAAADFADGLLLIDPDGSVAEAAANSIPRHFLQNIFYLDPSDVQHPFGWNILDNTTDPSTLALAVCSFFDAVMPEGQQTLTRGAARFVLYNYLRLLCDTPNTTFLGLLKLLKDKFYRSHCLSYMADPVVLNNVSVIEGDPYYKTGAALLEQQIGTLLSIPILRNIFGQEHCTFSLAAPKIIIANLNRAKIGDLTAYLLGSLLIARSVNPVYISRLGFFAFDHMATLFARSDFTVTVDFLDELTPKLSQAVLQFEDKYVFKTNREDAEKLAFYVGVSNPSLLVDLDPDQYKALSGDPTVPPAPAFRSQLKGIRKRSRACHTRRRTLVETTITNFFTDFTEG